MIVIINKVVVLLSLLLGEFKLCYAGLPLASLRDYYYGGTAEHDESSLPVTYSCGEDQNVGNYLQPWQERYDDDDGDEKKSKYGQPLHDENTIEDFLRIFRDHPFDSWNESYEGVKKRSSVYKSKLIAPYVKSGDSIYESASGIGLNLFLTYEIIQSLRPDIQNLTFYGNEYLTSSSQRGNQILDALFDESNKQIPKGSGHKKGVYCQGDSSDLSSFVPSNSFDIVYTGYISPLSDPLGLESLFNETMSIDERYSYMRNLCKEYNKENEDKEDNNDKTTKTKKKTKMSSNSVLVQMMIQKQEDWYSLWVNEMIRIAKPGSPIIIEQIPDTLCSSIYDWGGVSKDYWISTQNTIEKYNWDIDPTSIQILNDHVFKKRYHVFMRKNL